MARTFPSFRLYRDNRRRWRWQYDLGLREPAAVSPDSYATREECEKMIGALRSSMGAPLWIAKLDLNDV